MNVLGHPAAQNRTRADLALAAVIGIMLAASAALVAALAALKVSRLSWKWPFDLCVALIICAVILLLRQDRARAAVTGLAVFVLAAVPAMVWDFRPGPLLGATALGGLIVLGMVAVRTLRPRPAALIGITGTVVVAASEIGRTTSFHFDALFGPIAVTIWAAALAAGVWLRYRDHQHLAAVEAIRRQERLELARELHDAVAHHVTGIIVQAQASQFACQDRTEPLLVALHGIESAGLDTMTAVRQLVTLLRDPEDTSGVSPAPEPIGQLVERFAQHGPVVDLRQPPQAAAAQWPPEVASTVYRIIQESLTNISRHAPAAGSVTVTVTDDLRRVAVEVTDDAAASSRHYRTGTGYGLVGMRERVEALGGEVSAGPQGGSGWAVRASLPVAARGRP